MAPATSDTLPGDGDDVSVQELVFSCCICQATVTDVYATVESDQGFHSGSSSEEGIVTKMWITSCSHVTCSKHLEGGAVPFHPQDQQPRAPCPKCIADKNDDSPKDLFSIQGLEEGQYDPTIPEMWMHCPAIKLDDSIPGIDAVRFQYMALCHYGRQIRKHLKAALQEQTAADAALAKERKARKRLQSEQVELQNRVAALQKMEAQVKKWEDRQPVIKHYMRAFPEMTKDNERMRSQLIELGFDVPMRKYLFEPAELAHSAQADHQIESQHSTAPTVSGGARPQQLSDQENSSSARKRKREESFAQEAVRTTSQAEGRRGNSRDLMPPPLPRAAPTQRSLSHVDPSASRQSIRYPRQLTTHHNGSAWTLNQSEDRVEQNRNMKEDNGYMSREAQSQLETSAGRQYTNRSFHQPLQPYTYLGPSAHMQQQSAQPYHYEPVSLAQLSLQSTSHDDILAGRQTSSQPTSNCGFAPDSTSASHELYRDQYNVRPRYEYDHRNDAHVKPGSQYFSNDLGSVFQMESSLEMRTLQSSSQAKQQISNSPFFKRGGEVIRPDNIRQPPARSNGAISQFMAEDGRHRIPTISTPRLQAIDRPQNPGGSYHTNHRQPTYQHRQVASRASDVHQQSTGVPQMPGNHHGLFRRPDHPLRSECHSPAKAAPPNYARRLTLFPSSGPSLPKNQDGALSQIRGVRGASSHRNVLGYQSSAPSYAVARPLFSAGPRQSLRR